jgi:hypothetical protein
LRFGILTQKAAHFIFLFFGWKLNKQENEEYYPAEVKPKEAPGINGAIMREILIT